MKKILLVLLTLAFGSTFAQAKEKVTNFSGSWFLDFGQTKNPPAGLQSYNMVVNQDEQQLKVQTSLQGDLQAVSDPSNSGGYPGGSGGGYPGGRGGMGGGGMGGGMGRVGMGIPGVGMGTPRGGGGGGGGRTRAEGSTQGIVAAYKVYPQNAVFKLDGSESTAVFGDQESTDATLKADSAKNGEELKLSLMGSGDSGHGSGKIQVKEQWKISDDGKSLKVDRSIKSPEGSATVHLVFIKKQE